MVNENNAIGGTRMQRKRKNDTKKDNSQNGTHQKPTSVALSLSSKQLMTEHITGVEAMSVFGDLSKIDGVFTFVERWWLRYFLLQATNAKALCDITAVSKDDAKKVQEVSR
jgi:hypothetical protein